ncbi:CHAT domain-containing protein [Actinosynnema sp. NPDC049800]
MSAPPDLVAARLRAIRSGTSWNPPAPVDIDWAEAYDNGMRLVDRFNRTYDGDALAEGLAWLESALVVAGPDDLFVTVAHYAQAERLHREWAGQYGRRDEERAANERSLLAAEAALALAEAAGTDRLYHQLLIAGALRVRASTDRRPDDLDDAIALLGGAIRLVPPRHPDYPTALNILGNCLRERFEAGGDRADIDRAVALQREVVDRHGPGGPSAFQRSLARSLAARARRTGLPADIDAAIEWFDEALRHGAHLANEGPSTANTVGGLRFNRYVVSGDISDLELAIDRFEQALDSAPRESPSYAWYLRNVAVALTKRFEFSPDIADLDRAIELHAQALALVPADHPMRASFLEMLGHALVLRATNADDPSSLARAIPLLEEALESADTGHRPAVLIGLATALVLRGVGTGARADFDRAVALSGEAAELDDRDSTINHSLSLGRHAWALAQRHDQFAESGDRDAATARFRLAYDRGMSTMPPAALRTAVQWGDWAARNADWELAAEAFGKAIVAARLLAATQLHPRTHFVRLNHTGALPVRAAYALAKLGRHEEALLTLEQGRARLLSETLERDNADLSSLGGELRDRFRAAAARVRQLRVSPLSEDPGLTQHEAKRVRAEFDEVLAEVRRVPGHERFLLPAEDLDTDALGEPVGFLVATPAGGLALVASAERDPLAIWLPDLVSDALLDRVHGYLDAYRDRGADPAAWLGAIDDVTRWAWDTTMGPLLAELYSTPRIRLVPTGLLGLLPLHAAWRPGESGRRYAGDQVLITYGPTLRRAREDPGPADSLLVVTEPASTRATPLLFASVEADAACAAFPRHRRLDSVSATPRAVLENLGRHGVLHFACHGSAQLTDPLSSGLLLAGNRTLTLHEILGLGAVRARLAVFSACETGIGGTILVEEAISLPAVTLQTGVTGAVGSLWAVPDLATALLMAAFYDSWPHSLPDPAAALREAQQWVRDSDNATKLDRFPHLLRDVHDRMPPAARRLWLTARPHTHPYHWAAFALWGR